MNQSILNFPELQSSTTTNQSTPAAPIPIKKTIRKFEKPISVLNQITPQSTTQKKKLPLTSLIEKEQKLGLVWGPNCKLLEVSEPTHVTIPKCKKRFQVVVKWFDGMRMRQRTVRFGEKDRHYFYEHKNEMEKIRALKLLRDYDDPLKHNFYVKHILL